MSKVKNAGDLRTRIDVYKATEERDNAGNVVAKPYQFRFSRWAKMDYKTSKAVNNSNEIISEVLTTITTRYTDEIAPSDIIVIGTRLFVQNGPPIDYEARHAFVELTCKEVVDNGEKKAYTLISGLL